MPLQRKQAITHEAFAAAFANIEALVSRDECTLLVENAVEAIWQRRHVGERLAFAWSGGKDSQVLRFVCEHAGVLPCVLALTNLEYPAFLQWATDHMPEELSIINTGQDLAWLRTHQDWCFPQTAQANARWFHVVQHRAQDLFFAQKKIDTLILGRRRLDGNFMGKGPAHEYVKADGVRRWAPLFEWTHEQVFAVLHYYDLPLPPIYHYPRGYAAGTSPWPARLYCRSVRQGWAETEEIDRLAGTQLLAMAADAGIVTALDYLNEVT